VGTSAPSVVSPGPGLTGLAAALEARALHSKVRAKSSPVGLLRAFLDAVQLRSVDALKAR
jgi:hypothetical protein